MSLDNNENSVAVIIPTFSRVETTIKAVNSALAQTIKPKEIYVIDDGSPDYILQKLQQGIDQSAVTLIKNYRSSHPGIARNVGVALASARWIAFLDSDDYWIENKLEIQLKFAQMNSARAICSNAFTSKIDDKKSFYERLPKNISTRKLLRNNLIINSSVLIERELLLSVGGVATNYAVRGVEDYATWLRISKLEDWYVINENLLHYDQNSSDSIRKLSHTNYYSQVHAWLDFASWLRENTESKQLSLRATLNLLREFIGRTF